MKLNTETASELYQEATQKPPGDADCPNEEQLHAAAESTGSADERLEIAQHLAHCSSCSATYLAARREATPGNGIESWQLKPWALRLAAVLMLSIGAGWMLRSQLDRPPPVPSDTRRAAEGAELPGADLALELAIEPADSVELASAPEQLSWTGRPAATYQVLVFDQQLERLWQGDSKGTTHIALPDELRQHMTPGATIYWRIIERVELERRESPLFRFQITAKSH